MGVLKFVARFGLALSAQQKIAERRRNELSQAIAQAKIQGLSVSMLTLTAPHYISDDLPDLLNRMMSAYTKILER